MVKKQESFPTQQFIEIESIKDDAITVKNGVLRKVLLISGTNFSLKSEEEQGIIIYAFQGFLNSIDFTLQIFIHSRKLNISDYLTKLENLEIEEKNELLRNQISEYREFIRSFVEQNAIMQKGFSRWCRTTRFKFPEPERMPAKRYSIGSENRNPARTAPKKKAGKSWRKIWRNWTIG